MDYLKKLWKKLLHGNKEHYNFMVHFHMQSGKTLYVLCDNLDVEKDSSGKLHIYKMDGVKSGHSLFIDINEIEAITYNKFMGWA